MSQRRRVSLVDNTTGEIDNPLRDIPRDELLERVARFHQGKGLPDDILPLLKKGALVAQNPAGFESMDDLDAADKTALREETTHRWKHPWALYYTIILNSIAAAIQGWDQVRRRRSIPPPCHAQTDIITPLLQTGSNGANLSFPVALGIPDTAGSSCGPVASQGDCAKNSWIIGLVNAMPYITICLL
jgi:hypothetical protein